MKPKLAQNTVPMKGKYQMYKDKMKKSSENFGNMEKE